MNNAAVGRALADIVSELDHRGQRCALVGGLGASIRGEVRFTRDVDLAIVVGRDEDAETLVQELATVGYRIVALVEHDTRKRLATIRLRSPSGVIVDLLTASSGIEREVVDRAQPVTIEGVGVVRVARAEELLALKILSMTDARPQDRIDATNLVAANPALDLATVRNLLNRITERGYHRDQDLGAKLATFLAAQQGPD